ncbi:hypothetical protein KY285_019246 [Solanum tuberosum]|nr:hypothetical protein KY285_019246 [Solanum tuberosum]
MHLVETSVELIRELIPLSKALGNNYINLPQIRRDLTIFPAKATGGSRLSSSPSPSPLLPPSLFLSFSSSRQPFLPLSLLYPPVNREKDGSGSSTSVSPFPGDNQQPATTALTNGDRQQQHGDNQRLNVSGLIFSTLRPANPSSQREPARTETTTVSSNERHSDQASSGKVQVLSQFENESRYAFKFVAPSVSSFN